MSRSHPHSVRHPFVDALSQHSAVSRSHLASGGQICVDISAHFGVCTRPEENAPSLGWFVSRAVCDSRSCCAVRSAGLLASLCGRTWHGGFTSLMEEYSGPLLHRHRFDFGRLHWASRFVLGLTGWVSAIAVAVPDSASAAALTGELQPSP